MIQAKEEILASFDGIEKDKAAEEIVKYLTENTCELCSWRHEVDMHEQESVPTIYSQTDPRGSWNLPK